MVEFVVEFAVVVVVEEVGEKVKSQAEVVENFEVGVELVSEVIPVVVVWSVKEVGK